MKAECGKEKGQEQTVTICNLLLSIHVNSTPAQEKTEVEIMFRTLAYTQNEKEAQRGNPLDSWVDYYTMTT